MNDFDIAVMLQTLHIVNGILDDLDEHPTTKDAGMHKALENAAVAVMEAYQVAGRLGEKGELNPNQPISVPKPA